MSILQYASMPLRCNFCLLVDELELSHSIRRGCEGNGGDYGEGGWCMGSCEGK